MACDDLELNNLTSVDKQKIDGALEKVKQLPYYEQIDSMIYINNGFGYEIYLFPSSSSSFIETSTPTPDQLAQVTFPYSVLKNIKNTHDNFYPYVILKYDKGGSKNFSYIDKSDNTKVNIEFYNNSGLGIYTYIYMSTLCIKNSIGDTIENYKPNNFGLRDHYIDFYYYVACKLNNKLNYKCESYRPEQIPPPEPQPPQPTPQDPTDGTGTSCPTSGIYGGYGKKLTDIKLFLYATNVTNGTIKLNKPQLEVGTVATDWRPNADEAIKHYTPAYKQVKGLAIQQGSNGKKYLEIPTVEGTIYGADLWGGDTAKLLKDEIAELKEQIKELKNQIK